MAQYVYIFFEPKPDPAHNKVFYVGKGTGNRPKGHLTQSRVSSATVVSDDHKDLVVEAGAHPEDVQAYELTPEESGGAPPNEKKVQYIQHLAKKGVAPKQMIRVIAQGLDDSMSKTLESFAIRFVYGLRNLTNKVEGEHAERFRPFGDWSATYWENGDRKGLDLRYYVYVLRNPRTGEVVYVGKGKGKRMLAHSKELAQTPEEARTDKHKALAAIEADGKHKAEDIARVIAYDLTEGEAFAIESFAMKFVYGGTANAVRGHDGVRFRAKGDWELRLGFDLPFLVAETASQARLMELDQWRGEGLVQLLESVVAPVTHVTWSANAKNFAAGACALYADVLGADQRERGRLYVFARSPKKKTITVEIRFEGAAQKKCGKEKFGPWDAKQWEERESKSQDLNHRIRREDYNFLPDAWTDKPTSEPKIATQRIIWMVALLQTDSLAALKKSVGEEGVKQLLNEDPELRKRRDEKRNKKDAKKGAKSKELSDSTEDDLELLVQAGGQAPPLPPVVGDAVAADDELPHHQPQPQPQPQPQQPQPPRLPAQDLFFQGIAGVPDAEDLISRLIALSNEMDCEVHHTHTPTGADLRIRCDRAAPRPTSQNILTMAWQPRLSRFSCRTYLPPEECIHLGLAEDKVRPNSTGPLPTVITPELGIDDDVFLSIVRASIHMFSGD